MKYFLLCILFFASTTFTSQHDSTVTVKIERNSDDNITFNLTGICPCCSKANTRFCRSRFLECGHHFHQWCLSQQLFAQLEEQQRSNPHLDLQASCPKCHAKHLLFKPNPKETRRLKSALRTLKNQRVLKKMCSCLRNLF